MNVIPKLEKVNNHKTCCSEQLTCILMFSGFTAALGMFQFGYNVGIINETQFVIENFIHNVHHYRTNTTLSDNMLNMIWSFVVSFYDIGGMIGGLTGGLIARSVGRKQGLMLINISGIAGTLLVVLSKPIRSYEIIILGRLFIGYHCGLSTVIVPLYISEISPNTLRGGLGMLTNLGASMGMLLGMIFGVPDFLGTPDMWPYLFGLNIIPTILQLIFLPFCPESPHFLFFTRQKENATRDVLERLRRTTNVNDELDEMRTEKGTEERVSHTRLVFIFRRKDLQMPLLISIVIQLSVQLSGVIMLFYYSTNLFILSGIDLKVASYSTVGLGLTQLLMTIVTIPLMDRAGRRILLLYGLGGMFICGVTFTVSLPLKYKWTSYVSVTSIFLFVIFFSVGPASISWLIVAELFTHSLRATAMSIAMLVTWISRIFVTLSFPYLRKWIPDYILLPSTVFLAFFWIFTYFLIPETKNKSFTEIASLFQKKKEVVQSYLP